MRQRAFLYLLAMEFAVGSAACARYPALQESKGSVSDAGVGIGEDGNSHQDADTLWDHILDGDDGHGDVDISDSDDPCAVTCTRHSDCVACAEYLGEPLASDDGGPVQWWRVNCFPESGCAFICEGCTSDADCGESDIPYCIPEECVCFSMEGYCLYYDAECTTDTDCVENEQCEIQSHDCNCIPKSSVDGQLVWAVSAGSSESWDFGLGIANLDDGSSLVTGEFGDTATFGSGETNETTLTSAGGSDVFVAKYNPDGTLAWARRAGGEGGSDWGNDISALPDGSSLVTGYFEETALFGPGEDNETMLTSEGGRDVFVARYNPDGTLAWAVRTGGMGWDISRSIAVLPDGSSIITGGFEGTATFGPGEANETSLTEAGENNDIFVARFNPDGTLAWARRAGAEWWDAGYAVDTQMDGSCLVTGAFRRNAVFGDGDINETILTSAGDSDVFVARYNDDGSLAWARRAGGEQFNLGRCVAALPDGSYLVAGGTSGVVVFGPGEENETTLGFPDVANGFVARYDSDGKLAWAFSPGERSSGSWLQPKIGVPVLSALPSGSFLVTSYFKDQAIFGPGEASETTLVSAGLEDVYIASYNANGTLAWARRMGGEDIDTGESITAINDGSCLLTGRFEGTATFGLDDDDETILTSAGGADVFVMRLGP